MLLRFEVHSVLGSLLVDAGRCLYRTALACSLSEHDMKLRLTSWLFWSSLSPTESLAAEARVPREASESLATCLLASDEAWLVAPWTDSET